MNDFLSANIFSGFSSWKSIAYAGEQTPKILKFEIRVEEGGPRSLYLAAIISKEGKTAWQSFQDVLERTAILAQNTLRGFFGLDVLSVDIQTGLRNFNPRDMAQLMINHSKELGPSQKKLVRYGQLFALLHYRAPADWGKVEVKTHVEFFRRESDSSEVTEAGVRAALMGSLPKNEKTPGDPIDLLLKKMLREGGRDPRAIYLMHDLSVHPVWDPAHPIQQERIRAWLEKERQRRSGLLPEIHISHAAFRTPLDLKRYFSLL